MLLVVHVYPVIRSFSATHQLFAVELWRRRALVQGARSILWLTGHVSSRPSACPELVLRFIAGSTYAAARTAETGLIRHPSNFNVSCVVACILAANLSWAPPQAHETWRHLWIGSLGSHARPNPWEHIASCSLSTIHPHRCILFLGRKYRSMEITAQIFEQIRFKPIG